MTTVTTVTTFPMTGGRGDYDSSAYRRVIHIEKRSDIYKKEFWSKQTLAYRDLRREKKLLSNY